MFGTLSPFRPLQSLHWNWKTMTNTIGIKRWSTNSETKTVCSGSALKNVWALAESPRNTLLPKMLLKNSISSYTALTPLGDGQFHGQRFCFTLPRAQKGTSGEGCMTNATVTTSQPVPMTMAVTAGGRWGGVPPGASSPEQCPWSFISLTSRSPGCSKQRTITLMQTGTT